MKNFFTSMLGTLVALVIFALATVLLGFGVLGTIAALNSHKTADVEPGSYLVFDLQANITDAPPAFDFSALTNEHSRTLQLRTVTRALRAAAKDKRIAGVFITGNLQSAGYGNGYAALREVRDALRYFKASGKPVKAFLTSASTKDYYLASVATELAIDPYGLILMPGLASESAFFAGAAEKYGVGVQVTRVGKYKSYVEPFIRKDMSPENREQVQTLLDDLWGGIVHDIAASRHLTTAQIQSTVDTEGLIQAGAAKTAHLVDRVAYRDEIIAELRKATGRTRGKETFTQIDLSSYARVAKDVDVAPAKKDGDKAAAKPGRIAVVYAEGEIVDGEGDAPGRVGGARFSRELRQLRQDPGIKAIVLRVNSPGGSVSASEEIQREVRLARKAKPVVVSMGTYAASGGYWISAYSDRIFAEPTTVTGSIGVFGLQFDVQKLANDLGVTFDGVKTGKFADAITITRPKTPEELAVFQRMVDRVYGDFVTRVAEGRKLDRKFVEEIAQGRVWSGAAAKKLGLIDEFGGLGAAVHFAADKAGLGANYRVVEYPRKKDLAQLLQEFAERFSSENARTSGVAAQIVQRIETGVAALKACNDPQGLYARLPLGLSIR
jgi:protease-4